MALYATCMPLPSDTFHDKLFACDRGDDADYDHDHEERLWLSMQPVCLCRLTPFMISFLCSNLRSSESTHLSSGAVCTPPCSYPCALSSWTSSVVFEIFFTLSRRLRIRSSWRAIICESVIWPCWRYRSSVPSKQSLMVWATSRGWRYPPCQ